MLLMIANMMHRLAGAIEAMSPHVIIVQPCTGCGALPPLDDLTSEEIEAECDYWLGDPDCE